MAHLEEPTQTAVFALPARANEEPACALPARGDVTRMLRVTFTRRRLIIKSGVPKFSDTGFRQASANNLAGVSTWAADPSDGASPAWLPSVAELGRAALEWCQHQEPPQQSRGGSPGGRLGRRHRGVARGGRSSSSSSRSGASIGSSSRSSSRRHPAQGIPEDASAAAIEASLAEEVPCCDLSGGNADKGFLGPAEQETSFRENEPSKVW